LQQLVISSVNGLEGNASIPANTISKWPLWRDKPPLLPDEAQLKPLLRLGLPPALRCAVWTSNVVARQDPEHALLYRTLAKAQALQTVYETIVTKLETNLGLFLEDSTTREREEQRTDLWKQQATPTLGCTLAVEPRESGVVAVSCLPLHAPQAYV